MEQDIVIAGIPRGGTTLTCALLDKLPDTYALHEPMRPARLLSYDNPEKISKEVERFFDDTRQAILDGRPVTIKHIDGKVQADHVSERFVEGVRYGKTVKGPVVLDKPRVNNFVLAVKHPSFFTSILALLVDRYRCYAIIRNPLAILGSWNTVSFNVREGFAPNAQRFDQALDKELKAIENHHSRQIHLLNWFYAKYHQLLPRNSVLRYEDIVESKGSVLQVITENARQLNVDLENRNRSGLYNKRQMQELGKMLLDTEGEYRRYYSRDSIRALMSG